VFSNIDEHVRRKLRRPAEQSSTRTARKGGPCWYCATEGTSAPDKAGDIDVRRLERGHATGNRALCVPFQAPREVSEGRFRRSFRELTRLRSSSTRAPHERGDRTARSRQRAVKHEAAGGRMTARWSGAVPGCKVATPRPERPRSRTPAGFPTALGRESPEATLLNKRVLVTRNVGCRSGFEAS